MDKIVRQSQIEQYYQQNYKIQYADHLKYYFINNIYTYLHNLSKCQEIPYRN